MTNKEQNITIAEACGWKYRINDGIDAALSKSYPEQMLNPVTGKIEVIPDYLNDLNACHEMEKVLTTDQAWDYARELQKLQGTYAGKGSGSVDQWEWHATAPQRAEAFIRVNGR